MPVDSPFRAAFCATLVSVALAAAGCRSKDAGNPAVVRTDAGSGPKASGLDVLGRLDFNRRAVELNQPLFWRADANGNRSVDPEELVVTWPEERSAFVDAKPSFTPRFRDTYAQMVAPDDPGPSPAEQKRRRAVRLELLQGRPTLIESDFSKAAAPDKALVAHMANVAKAIERVYARQKGTFGMESQIPAGDPASIALLHRNQGPFCVAPKTEKDPDCRALAQPSKPVFGLYPAEIQTDAGFCRMLEKEKNSKELLDHFSIVVKGKPPNTFSAVKYSEAYAADMQAVAAELSQAASALGPDESALREYLERAAQAFRDDDWEPANRAWVAMTAENSKYYLRVAPDEVYYEPCAWKAGFALTFARINRKSLALQKQLEPFKQDLENDLAALAGKPYAARTVKFKLPDFIDIVLNAGDSRSPTGATVGQSLPNWGRVAETGGRTVAMTNLFTDPDSKQTQKDSLASLYCKGTMSKVSDDTDLGVIGTVLHEAAHNLGPSHDYAVKGKVDTAVFGGPLASTFEELKAQTAALYFHARMVEKRVISPAQKDASSVGEVSWALGHVSEGMYDAEGRGKPYSQLASIQLGSLRAAGALEWLPNETAADGKEHGCFELHLEKWDRALTDLMKEILEIKSQGDRARAEALKKRFVDAEDDWKKLRDVIAERLLRVPKASLVYSITGL